MATTLANSAVESSLSKQVHSQTFCTFARVAWRKSHNSARSTPPNPLPVHRYVKEVPGDTLPSGQTRDDAIDHLLDAETAGPLKRPVEENDFVVKLPLSGGGEPDNDAGEVGEKKDQQGDEGEVRR